MLKKTGSEIVLVGFLYRNFKNGFEILKISIQYFGKEPEELAVQP
jgi:hypothetical protein